MRPAVPEGVAQSCAFQIAAALQHCVAKSVIHRDLCPKNILVFHDDSRGISSTMACQSPVFFASMVFKLADFGISKQYAAVCPPGTSERDDEKFWARIHLEVGGISTANVVTANYRAPELFNWSMGSASRLGKKKESEDDLMFYTASIDVWSLGAVVFEMLQVLHSY